MSVVNGALANQTTFNNAFVSRTAPTTSTVAKLSLSNSDSTAVADAQKMLGELAGVSGQLEGDTATAMQYGSTNVVANGDTRKVAIGKLDVVVGNHATRLVAEEAISTDLQNRMNNAEFDIMALQNGGANGGGGSLLWNAPQGLGAEEREENGLKVFVFAPQAVGEEQRISTIVPIPIGYNGGQAKIKFSGYCPETTSARWAFETIATLVKGGDPITTVTDQHTDNPGDFDGSPSGDVVFTGEHELSAPDGTINGQSMQAGWKVKITLIRKPPAMGTESTEEVKFIPSLTEVTFA